jgi:hypothetical protein
MPSNARSTVLPVLLVLAMAAPLTAQERRAGPERPDQAEARVLEHPALDRLPEDVRERQDMERRMGRDPVARITREHVLRALDNLPPGQGRPDDLPDDQPLPGDRDMPRELREMEEAERAIMRSAPRRPPSPQEVIDAIRALPDGPAHLEEVRRRGARVGAAPHGLAARIAALNPFRVRNAWADSRNVSILLTTDRPRSDNPQASLTFYGANVGTCCSNHTVRLDADFRLPLTGQTAFHRIHRTDHSVANISVNVPSAGWYAINVRGYSWGSRAELRRGAGDYSLVGQWDYRSASNGWRDYPVVVYLARGWHSFRFHPRDGIIAVRLVTIHSR